MKNRIGTTKLTLTNGERIFSIVNYTVLTLLTITCLYPMLYVLFASFSDPWEIMKHRGLLIWTRGYSLASYEEVFKNRSIWTGLATTCMNLVAGTSINILLTLLAAYGLSRKGFLFRNVIMFGISFTMFFSGGMIPTFLVVRSLGLFDNRWAMILPTAMSAWNLIILRTAMQGIPDSLEESALLDGANDFVILFRISAPLVGASIAVLVLYYGVGHWNQWYQSLLYIQTRSKYPLQMIMREILISNSQEQQVTSTEVGTEPIQTTIKYATIIVGTLPILCVYPFLQRYFVKGVMIGAIKG